MKKYPQLHIYDFLKILRYYEKELDPKILKVIKTFSFECYTISFDNTNYKQEIH